MTAVRNEKGDLNSLKKILVATRPADAEWMGIRYLKESTTERAVRDGKPQANSTGVTEGAMIEVLIDGQFGYAATPQLDADGIKQAAELARNQAKKAAPHAVHRFSVDQRPQVRAEYTSPTQKSLDSVSAGEINRLLIQISEKLKSVSSKIVRAESYARTVEMETVFVSSNGSEAMQKFSLITTDFQSTAQEGSVIQRRTDGGLRGRSLQGGWEHFYGGDLWQRVERVARQSVELAEAPECPSDTRDLLIMPDQMMLQIHESIGHPLEIDRILGDERNYAGWSFVNLEDFGRLQYGSKIMNVTFDPTVAHEFASYAFDDIGNPSKREFLIQDGLLKRGLGSLESQTRAKVQGVANQRASSWNRPPIDRMANINLEPGTSSLDEMIAATQKGVLMESNRSWSIDDFRNKFQFGCEYGRLIEDGKLKGVVRNPNYRGITVPFWTNLKMVGTPGTVGVFGTPYCGKGEPNQAIRVGHSSPSCLFSNIEVFGGAS
jgi:predicted Zn-dependent protease